MSLHGLEKIYRSLMSVNICPIAKVNAPIERVWNFLSEPANYALWWDAQTLSIVPEGRASAHSAAHYDIHRGSMGRQHRRQNRCTHPCHNWIIDSRRGSGLVHAHHTSHALLADRHRSGIGGFRRRLILSAQHQRPDCFKYVHRIKSLAKFCEPSPNIIF